MVYNVNIPWALDYLFISQFSFKINVLSKTSEKHLLNFYIYKFQALQKFKLKNIFWISRD